MVKEIHVVAAVIMRDGLVLCARRGPQQSLPGMWEFPGGKVEAGEPPEAALVREIREELGCEISVGKLINTHAHVYPFARVSLDSYWCTLTSGDPEPAEHAELEWIPPNRIHDLEWAPADVPAVELVRRAIK